MSSKIKMFWQEAYFIASKHNMNCMSAQLTYGVIVAIVPFFAVLFAFIHSRRNFSTILDGIINPFIKDNFGASVGNEIAEYIRSIILHVQITELSIISFVSFLVTVILLLLLIESVFNALLDARNEKSFLKSLLKCWLLLAFSPFLFVLVTLRSDFLIATFNFANNFLIREDIKFLKIAVGYASQALFFSVLYYIMPSRRMKFSAAFIGACFTTIALDIVRYINVYLVKTALMADTTQLYGSVPLIAILFFVWLRLVLLIILIGFVISSAFERVFHPHKKAHEF